MEYFKMKIVGQVHSFIFSGLAHGTVYLPLWEQMFSFFFPRGRKKNYQPDILVLVFFVLVFSFFFGKKMMATYLQKFLEKDSFFFSYFWSREKKIYLPTFFFFKRQKTMRHPGK